MDFQLSETQEMLQSGARRLFSSAYEGEKAHAIDECDEGFSSGIWSQIVELGWHAVALPESVGGSGLGLIELCILAEEAGRAAASLPLVACSGLAAKVLEKLTEQELKSELLSLMATTDSIVTAALVDDGSRDERTTPSLSIRESNESVILSGIKQLVPYAAGATWFLVSGRTSAGETALVAVDASSKGITVTRHKVLGGDPRYQLAFDQVSVPNHCILARGEPANRAIQCGLNYATVIAMSEVVGNCEGILSLTAEYAKIREQFGTAIGAFQAVSHPIADMRIQTDACRMLTLEAAWMLNQGQDAAFEIASAKVFANEAVAKITVDGQRLHGAIGYSNEYSLQLYTRRARAFCMNWGNTDQQVDAAAAALGI